MANQPVKGPWWATTLVCTPAIKTLTVLTIAHRETVCRRKGFRLLAAFCPATRALLDPHRPPRRSPHDAHLLRPFGRCSLSLTGPFAALPPRPAHLHFPDSPGLATCFPRRHSAVCSPCGLGWMDRLGRYYHYCRKWDCNMRHEAHIGQPQGKEAAHR